MGGRASYRNNRKRNGEEKIRKQAQQRSGTFKTPVKRVHGFDEVSKLK